MKQAIINYIRAGYPGIYLVSHEEARAEATTAGLSILDCHLANWLPLLRLSASTRRAALAGGSRRARVASMVRGEV